MRPTLNLSKNTLPAIRINNNVRYKSKKTSLGGVCIPHFHTQPHIILLSRRYIPLYPHDIQHKYNHSPGEKPTSQTHAP